MRTSITVAGATRDALATLGQEMGSTSLDETVRRLIYAHECERSLARLDADPALAAEYQAQAHEWAELDMRVVE